ncbi:MAG: hypothetical protein ACLPKB_12555 [Xanthobacteraceae bacterium]
MASMLAIGTTAALAENHPAWRYGGYRYDSDYDGYVARPMPPIYGHGYNYRFRNPPYGLGRLYRLDPDTCRPGACRDNPYY